MNLIVMPLSCRACDTVGSYSDGLGLTLIPEVGPAYGTVCSLVAFVRSMPMSVVVLTY